jgi:hypothetical protein
MSLHCLDFFIPFIPIAIPSIYTDDIFSLVFTDEVSDGRKIWSVNITAKYQRKNLLVFLFVFTNFLVVITEKFLGERK